ACCNNCRANFGNGGRWGTLGTKVEPVHWWPSNSHRVALAHPDGRVYSAAFQVDGLLMSEDEGATWPQISDLEPTSLAAPPLGDSQGTFLAATYEKLHRVTPPPREGLAIPQGSTP